MEFYVVYKDDYQYSEVFYSMERAKEYLYFVQTMEPKSNLHIESVLEEQTMTEKQLYKNKITGQIGYYEDFRYYDDATLQFINDVDSNSDVVPVKLIHTSNRNREYMELTKRHER